MSEAHTLHPSARGVRFTRPICPAGHDKRASGIHNHRECRLCKNTSSTVPERLVRDVAIRWEDVIGDVPRFASRSFCERCRRFRLKPTNYPLCGTCLVETRRV